MTSTISDSDAVSRLIAVVESASIESTAYKDPAKKWDDVLTSRVYIHARFDPGRVVQVHSPNMQAAHRLALPKS